MGILLYFNPELIPNVLHYTGSEDPTNSLFDFKSILLFYVFTGSFLFPAAFIYYLYSLKIIPNLSLGKQSSRHIPYLVCSIIYIVFAFFTYRKLPDFTEITIYFFLTAASILLVFFINIYWKISAHGTGLGGILGAMFAISVAKKTDSLLLFIIIFIILTGLACAARLKLNAHTPMQIIAGLILGILLGTSSIFFL
jgi:membrane-associated phospholipid phosphatase